LRSWISRNDVSDKIKKVVLAGLPLLDQLLAGRYGARLRARRLGLA
jgi:hypothetical protein